LSVRNHAGRGKLCAKALERRGRGHRRIEGDLTGSFRDARRRRHSATVSSLPVGTAIWRVNDPSFLVRHDLTDEERRIADTDQRMTS